MITLFISIAAFLLASVNYIDKFLIEKYFKGGSIGTLVIFSSLVGLPVLLIISFLSPHVFQLPIANILMITLGGIFVASAVMAYLYALEMGDTSAIVPQFLMIPVISAVLGYLFLSEELSFLQVVVSGVVMLGAYILSSNLGEEININVGIKPFLLMFTSSIFFALNITIFKGAGIDEPFWVLIFWENFGLLMFGLAALLFKSSFRKQFFSVWRLNKKSVLSINITNEVINILGKTIFNYSLFLAPVAIASVMLEGLQPVFIVLIGIILYKFNPELLGEKLTKVKLVKRVSVIVIMIFSVILLSQK